MSVIRCLVADAGVPPVVIIVVKIKGLTGLCVGQVRENGPLAALQFFGFDARPAAFGLRIILALAAAALRTHCLVAVEQGPVGVAAVLAAPVGMHDEPGRGRLG